MNLLKRAYFVAYRRLRVSHYKILSPNTFSGEPPVISQPVLFKGRGEIRFDGKCIFGLVDSPGYFSSYSYIEAREKGSRVILGGGSHFNNNFHLIAGTGEICLGANLRVGVNCTILNSDFHNLDPERRDVAPFPHKDILIGNNVFIGNNVTILKGVTIGDNATIGTGSVVTSDIPPNTVAAGVPAKIIKKIGQ